MSGKTSNSAAPFEARYSVPGHLYLLTLLLVPFVPLLWFFIAGLQSGSPIALGIGSLGTGCFGAGLLAVLVRIMDRRVRLRITDDTLWLPDYSHSPIPRRSIKKVRRQDAWVSLFLTKPERFPPTRLFRRAIMRVFSGKAMRQQYGDVWIYPILFDCSAADLLERI